MDQPTSNATSQPGPPSLPDQNTVTPNASDQRKKKLMFGAVALVGAVIVFSRQCSDLSSPVQRQDNGGKSVAKQRPPSNPTPEQVKELRTQLDQQIEQMKTKAEEVKKSTQDALSSSRAPMTREEALQTIGEEGKLRQVSSVPTDPQQIEVQRANQERAQQERDARIAQEKKELGASNIYQNEPAIHFHRPGDPVTADDAAVEARGHEVGETDSAQQTEQRGEEADAKPVATRSPLDFDPAKVRSYLLPQGTILQAVLITQLDGERPGPVMAQVTQDAYLPGTRKVMIPAGAVVMGEAKAVSAQHQRRLAVFFHRVLVRTGGQPYGIPLDEQALSQAGESGLHDKVDNHYASIFGASLAVGAIGGLAQIGNNGSYVDPSSQVRAGVSQHMAQSSEQILNQFLNQLPKIVIRTGERIVILLTGDLPVPSFDQMVSLATAAGPMVPTDIARDRRKVVQ